MPKRLSPRERFEQLVSTYEPAVRLAFLDAIDDITSNIVLRRVVERLERGDINGAVAAMHLDPAAFRPLDEVIRQAFNGGGVATGEQMPALKDPEGNRVVVRFDIRNIEAVNWLREHSTTLVTNVVADQQTAIKPHSRRALPEATTRPARRLMPSVASTVLQGAGKAG